MSAAQYSMKEPEKDPHPARKYFSFTFFYIFHDFFFFYLFVLFHKQTLSTYKIEQCVKSGSNFIFLLCIQWYIQKHISFDYIHCTLLPWHYLILTNYVWLERFRTLVSIFDRYVIVDEVTVTVISSFLSGVQNQSTIMDISCTIRDIRAPVCVRYTQLGHLVQKFAHLDKY